MIKNKKDKRSVKDRRIQKNIVFMSARNKPPVSLSKLAKSMENKDGKIACDVRDQPG